MSTVELRRPRRVVPRVPGGEFTLEPPPEPERPVPAGVLARLLPVVMLLGAVAFVASSPLEDRSAWLFGGMFALSTVGLMFAGGGGRGAGQRRAALDEQRRDYLRYLDVARRRVRTVAAEQRAALEHLHPDPAAWPAVLAAGRLWERRGSDRRLRPAPHRPRRATARDPPRGPADRSRRRHGARHRAGSAPLPARPRRGPGPAGRAVAAQQLRRVARARAGRARRGGAGPGAGDGRPVRAVARPGRRAAGGGRAAVPGPGVGVGQVAPARRAPAPVRRHRAAAHGERRGRRRPAAGGRRSWPGGRRAAVRASRTCSWSSTTRPAPARGRRWPA